MQINLTNIYSIKSQSHIKEPIRGKIQFSDLLGDLFMHIEAGSLKF